MGRQEAKKLYRDGKILEALDEFLMEGIDPTEDAELSYFLGLCYTRTGDTETALEFLERVLDIDMHILRTFQTRMVIGYIYNTKGDFSQAEYQLQKLVDDGFESPQIYSSLGFACWNQGDLERAVDCYESALDMDPDHATSLNSLGYILAERGERIQDALELCQKALAQDPLNTKYLDSMGWSCYKSGRIGEALDYLGRACKNEDVPETIRDHYEQVLKTG